MSRIHYHRSPSRRRIPLNVQNPVTKLWEAAITEDHVGRDVDEVLALNRAEFYVIRERIPVCHTCKRKIGRSSESGIPDRIGYFPPLTCEFQGVPNEWAVHFRIELKRPGGKHRVMQDIDIQKAQGHGVIAFFAESREMMVAEFAVRGLVLKIS